MKRNQLMGGLKAGTAALALLGLSLAVGVRAEQMVSTPVTMPIHINGTLEVLDCDNSPGPQITLSGSMLLGGLNEEGIFRNNVKGTHTHIEEFTTTAVVLPEDGCLTIPKQPAFGGTGGNPFIWIQFIDDNENALCEEIFLGRCVQGLADVDADVLNFATAWADIDLDCANHPGPFITLNGGLFLSGLKARFIFRNNDNRVGGPHKAVRTADVELIGADTPIQFPKQPSLEGAGGNPWMWIKFLDSDDDPLCDEIFVGRCVQSSK